MGDDTDHHTSSGSQYHVILFPFMSKGHTIPLLHLARLLLRRRIAVTIITTPANHPFISNSLADTAASIIDLPFPQNVPDIPSGIESTDKLPSISVFPSFANATKLMQEDFECVIEALPSVNFIVSDGFLWWTLESAIKFGFPRFVFYGMCAYSTCLTRAVNEDRLLYGPESDDELITVTRFPWIKVTRNDFEPHFRGYERKGQSSFSEFYMKVVTATRSSHGYVINSFYELEPFFVDFINNCQGSGYPKAWCVGPLCLVDPPSKTGHPDIKIKPSWINWLDDKMERERSALYVAFGSQVEISSNQLKEIAIGLEKSNVNFLLVMRNRESELGDGFEARVKERGIIVRDWVDQREILMHPSVKGFLSHCGWNSVLESICAGVPILAWPMMAEQPLNARMVVEEIKIGLRVGTCDGSVRGFVQWEELKKMVMELMEGEKGKEVRKKVKEYAEMAKKAMEDKTGGSCRTFDMMLQTYMHNR